MLCIRKLPDDIQNYIINKVSYQDLVFLKSTCKKYYYIIKEILKKVKEASLYIKRYIYSMREPLYLCRINVDDFEIYETTAGHLIALHRLLKKTTTDTVEDSPIWIVSRPSFSNCKYRSIFFYDWSTRSS